MVKSNRLSRLGVLLLVVVFFNATLMPVMAASKEPDCKFDKEKPSFVHAQKVFNDGDYRCAELELNSLINDENTSLKDRAAARVLLVKVYNAMIHKDLSKPVETPAAEQVEKPALPAKDSIVINQPAAETKPWVFESKPAEKPWYKKWWAMALGVGVVATVAIVAGGGGETTDKTPPGALPPPPPPPSK